MSHSTPQNFNYCKALNQQQQEAVMYTEGPLLVLAGAGTGKTRVLTTRIAHLLNCNKALPGQILAVTFTNKAAKEMLTRITAMMSDQSDFYWCGTFHSISLRILRQHAASLGFSANFTILDSDDQLRLLKQLLADYNIDEKKHPAKLLSHVISRYKDKGWTPDQIPFTEATNFANGDARTLYAEYQKRLKLLQAMDFGDLILNVIELFNNNISVLEYYQHKFKYVLVDEYQDTNVAQYLWLRLFAQHKSNICCVGDDDQSIYGWRGAEVQNILRFEKDFANAKVVRLEQNYRSTSFILDAASELISYNKNRHNKKLWTANSAGELIKLNIFYDDKQEAREIANEIDSLTKLRQKTLSDIAILIRAGYQTRSFEESLNYMRIPYKIIGGAKFYDRLEIKDTLSYMRLINNPEDSLAFERIINSPKRGVGEVTIAEIRAVASNQNISLFSASEFMLQKAAFKPKVSASISDFLAKITQWNQMLQTYPYGEVIDKMLDESGYREMLKLQEPQEAKDRLDNIKELIRSFADFPSITDYLEHVILVTDSDSTADNNQVSILTMHAAKGLEFDTVFLPGWEEGVFPSNRSTSENGMAALEEERRLAYVAITRAKQNLYISYACNRRMYGSYQPSESSRFINELPKPSYELINNFSPYNKRHTQFKNSTTQTLHQPTPQYVKRVIHKTLGKGFVISVAEDNIAQVVFDEYGLKKISAEYLEIL